MSFATSNSIKDHTLNIHGAALYCSHQLVLLPHTNLYCQAIGLVQNTAQIQRLIVFTTIGWVQTKGSAKIGLFQTSALLRPIVIDMCGLRNWLSFDNWVTSNNWAGSDYHMV